MAHPGAAPRLGQRRSLASQLSLGALGLGLVLLVSLAWATGFFYVIARVGLPAPVSLALVDGVHVYVGLASVAFFAAKLSRVGFRQHVDGVPELLAWQRWISWSLAILYAAVYSTGVLLLIPWPSVVSKPLVNAHLLTAVWAALPSTWHVWHYRPQALAYLSRWGRRTLIRFWLGMGLVLLPLVVVLALPRALAPATKSLLGAAWEPAGAEGLFLDRLAITADRRTLVAGGEGLYVTPAEVASWRRVSFPAELILGLGMSPSAVYVGTSDGLYAGQVADGPYQRLPFPSREVHGIAVDPTNPQVIWASSRGGFWKSTDGGQDWVPESTGIHHPENAWAIAYFRGDLYGSDAVRVYRWDGSVWQPSADQGLVVSLDPSADGRELFASSMGQGLRVFDGHTWIPADEGLSAHGGSRDAIHVVSVTAPQGARVLAATMLNGVAISQDGRRDWSELRAGLPVGAVWRVIQVDHRLIAASDHGIYEYPRPQLSSAGVGWWVLLIMGALGTGLSAAAWGALPRRGLDS